jgi:hypothetical protein
MGATFGSRSAILSESVPGALLAGSAWWMVLDGVGLTDRDSVAG